MRILSNFVFQETPSYIQEQQTYNTNIYKTGVNLDESLGESSSIHPSNSLIFTLIMSAFLHIIQYPKFHQIHFVILI